MGDSYRAAGKMFEMGKSTAFLLHMIFLKNFLEFLEDYMFSEIKKWNSHCNPGL